MKHLTCKHGEQLKNTLFDDADDGIDENQGVTMPKTLTPTKQATLEGFMQSKKLYDINDKRALAISERIARMIALDLQPFSIVEDRGFKELVLYFDPRYTMPSRKYFSETVIPGMYDRCRARVQDMITDQDFLSVTSDIWTSRAKDAYISLTGHFINKDWRRVSILLGVREFNDRHTGVNISQIMKQMMAEWDIEFKILACTRDNGSNMVAALDMLDIMAIPCIAHTLQLVINDGIFKIKSVQDLISTARKMVSYFNHSVVAANCLTNMQKKLGCPEHCLVQDIETRWNSTFYMLERLIEQRQALSVTNAELNLKTELTHAQWTLAEKVVNVLGPIEEATRECSKESASASLVIPVISAIHNKLKVSTCLYNTNKSLFV